MVPKITFGVLLSTAYIIFSHIAPATPLEPSPATPSQISPESSTPLSDRPNPQRSNFQDSAYGLLGSQTATPIGENQQLLQLGGVTFKNPSDFRTVLYGESNRSNDGHFDVVYGISPNLQISAALSAKDDTIFVNLVRNPSQLQIISNVIPLQAKWRFMHDDRLHAAAVVGLEVANPFFGIGKRVVYRPNSDPTTSSDEIFAEDSSKVLGLSLPISYQATDRFRLHLNPRISFFPSQLAITSIKGDANKSKNAGIGFDGQNLDYYGTVAGIGIGASYAVSPSLQIAAEVTPIVAGRNSFDAASGNSILTTKTIWNAGLQYTPNNRTAWGLYATNRYSATSDSPSNLLAQPGKDWAVGVNLSYLNGPLGDRVDEQRRSYPTASAFWSSTGGYPSATLPFKSIFYQVGLGSSSQINPSVRYGVMDDLEVAISHNQTNRQAMPTETSWIARWGVLPDRGTPGVSMATGLGVVLIGNIAVSTRYNAYGELPISYRLPGGQFVLHATPKLLIPAQYQGVPTTLSLALGADWRVATNTQIFGSITPSISGANQLVAGKELAFQGNTPVYNFGVRQLFPQGNSTYGVELYYGNAAGSTGYQAMSALPQGDTQLGVRLSILNGTPTR